MRPRNDREAITLIMNGLRKKGIFPIHVDNGEEEIRVTTTAEVVKNVTDVDEAYVHVSMPVESGRESSFIWFVLGNEPEEVAADYGVSLSPYLDPIVNKWW